MTATTLADICAFLECAGRARRVLAATPEVATETVATGVAPDVSAGPGDVAWSRSPSAWIAFRGALLLAPEPDIEIPTDYEPRRFDPELLAKYLPYATP